MDLIYLPNNALSHWVLYVSYPTYEKVQEARDHLNKISYEHWIHDDLFSLNWWILLVSTIVPWIIWYRMVNKERIYEVFSHAMITGIIATILDVFGVDYDWWGYPDKLFAMIPPLFPADITFFPVVFSLIYQYSSNWKQYILYCTFASAVISYVIEPIFKLMGMYENQKMTHTMSFIGFIIFSIFIRLIILALSRKKISVPNSNY